MATTDFGIKFIDGFEEYQNVGWTLTGTAPTYSSSKSYGGNLATAWTSDSGSLSVEFGTFASNATGDPQYSLLIDVLIETAPNGGVWSFAGFGAGTTNTVLCNITSDLKPQLEIPEATITVTGSDALALETWYQVCLWGTAGTSTNAATTLKIRRKDATGTLLETITGAPNLATHRSTEFALAGRLAGAAGKIWLDNYVGAGGDNGAVPTELFGLVNKGTHMVGTLIPNGAGYQNEWTTPATYAAIDDWATGVAATDGPIAIDVDLNETASWAMTGAAAGVDSIYGIMLCDAVHYVNATTQFKLGYGMGGADYALQASTNAASATSLVYHAPMDSFFATDVVSSDNWAFSAIANIEGAVKLTFVNASNAQLCLAALGLRYIGSLVTGGASFGYILG